MKTPFVTLGFLVVLGLVVAFTPTPPNQTKAAKPKNIIFLLSDDHRYDFMGSPARWRP